jgi:histidinol-phosphatase (PHP family)
MLSNLHTHTTFCDGKSTAEETVLEAIKKGFVSLGFSGHGYTAFELTSCMKDEKAYIREIERLKELYKDKIEIYLGTEEDSFAPVDRSKYEYIIGSSHFLKHNGKILPIDLRIECMSECLTAFGGDISAISESYYGSFASYIKSRRPDVVGHFDLLTKYDEKIGPYFLGNPTHDKIAEHFISELGKDGFLFEINTGAIARGYRTTPYPTENLLYKLKNSGSPITLTSDCHNAEYLDCHFKEAKELLRDVGFKEIVILCNRKFTKIPLTI